MCLSLTLLVVRSVDVGVRSALGLHKMIHAEEISKFGLYLLSESDQCDDDRSGGGSEVAIFVVARPPAWGRSDCAAGRGERRRDVGRQWW